MNDNDAPCTTTTLLLGDSLTVLKGLPSASVQTCVTSPPYFGLRDYGVEGQLGLEPTPDEYIANMVDVFREVRRVLADDGTLWVNIGDSYASKPNGPVGAGGHKGDAPHVAVRTANARRSSSIPPGLKHKDLIGIPWMLAFALRADGWYLRQEIIWHKPNPMPESVTDRCTKSHESLFLLSKSATYFFDAQAVREPASDNAVSAARRNRADFSTVGTKAIQGTGFGQSGKSSNADHKGETRNRRSVWSIATRPYKGAHFATFPPALVEPCVLAGSRPGDVILDPFNGSGTTGQVALQHGRRYVGIELNPAYLVLTEARLLKAANDNRPAANDNQLGLFPALS
jgi:DNA modification methylase